MYVYVCIYIIYKNVPPQFRKRNCLLTSWRHVAQFLWGSYFLVSRDGEGDCSDFSLISGNLNFYIAIIIFVV